MQNLTPDLQFLMSEPLSAVSFVMDYVELHFNGSYLRCLEPPVVTAPTGERLAFPGPGSRDALCSRIGAEVKEISAVDGGELRVAFGDGAVIGASLAHDGRRSPEALHFHNVATGETQWW
jgi:hypothetical protein